MEAIFGNLLNLQWQHVVMWGIGGVLIWLAIKRNMEPTLLLPIGFGAILVNLPFSGAVTQVLETGVEEGPLDVLFDLGIANELFPLLLFIGIGAMIDFAPLLANPKLMIFGAAAQFGIFFTLCAATLLGFPIRDAASIAVIGAADGPTSIFVANYLDSNYLGAILVAAYSYMALVPIIQPPVIRMVTTPAERRIRMPYAQREVSKTARILFPIVITVIAPQRGTGRLFDVWQSDPGMRCAGQPLRDRPKGSCQSHHPSAGADSGFPYAGRGLFK